MQAQYRHPDQTGSLSNQMCPRFYFLTDRKMQKTKRTCLCEVCDVVTNINGFIFIFIFLIMNTNINHVVVYLYHTIYFFSVSYHVTTYVTKV